MSDDCTIEDRTLQIRDLIEIALDGLLGTYVLPNQREVPAIAILKTENDVDPPEGTAIKNETGVELAILYLRPYPIITRLQDGYMNEYEWQLYLKCWGNASKNLHECLSRLMRLTALNIKQILPVPGNESLGIPESVSVRIHEYWGINSR